MDRIDWTKDRTDAEWQAVAAGLRAQAQECEERRAESWDRSDTDGFLSQWASQQMAARYRFQASVAEDHGTVVQDALFRDGIVLPTYTVAGRFGDQYAIRAEWSARSRIQQWVGISVAQSAKRRAAHYAKQGLTLGSVSVRVTFDQRSDRHEALDQAPVAILSVDDNAAVSA